MNSSSEQQPDTSGESARGPEAKVPGPAEGGSAAASDETRGVADSAAVARAAAAGGRYRVGFDLGGTKMLSVLYDDQWNEITRRRKRTKSGDAKAGVKRILSIIEDLLKQAEAKPEQVETIGLGCPGPVDLANGVVHEAVNLSWQDVKLKRALESEFPARAEVLNDVDAGVFGEYRFGAAMGARTAVGVFPGTGIGGGCVYDGQVLCGKGISCMEVGHIQVQIDGPRCGCGAYGCLETVASRLAISAEAAKSVYRGEAPALRELAGTDLSDIRSGVIAKAVAAGDVAIEEIVRRAAQQLGRALAGIVHLLAPDVLVLGGGLVEAMPKLWVEEVERTCRKAVMQSYRDVFKVRVAKLGDDSAVLGAAAWAHQANNQKARK
ncbi:MAG: ROK family protein [Planctomycetales bacterium]|nr:ROK family protein [Planctomycetales bacterium]